jgi:aryl-phospho-beta-D-glucosidase BglC (GH1 family)
MPPSPPSPSPPPPSTAVAEQLAALRSGALQMNGVNLGGWLVLESFLSPEMFDNTSTTVPFGDNPPGVGVTGEYQLCLDAAQQDEADTTHTFNVTGRLRQAFADHRDTFVTEQDFILMAAVGINAVRIPVGYWLLAQNSVSRCCCCRSPTLHPFNSQIGVSGSVPQGGRPWIPSLTEIDIFPQCCLC